MEEKTKALSVRGNIKQKDVDGERRIVFVASSDKQDRHGEYVETRTLRLPLKGGGHIMASEIPADGIEGIDIPLMLNHSADVRDVIGSVRKAYFANGELVFEAGISSTEMAQEILTLIEEGHLSNAFSITMIDFDYDYENEIIKNAEVIEVSVVYRGSNREARLLAVKSLGGEPMPESEEVKAPVEEVTEEVIEKDAEPTTEETVETEAVAEAEEPAEDETEETVEESAEEPVEAETEEEKPAEEQTNNEESEMDKEIAKDAVVEKATPVVAVKEANYLESKKALADFRDCVLNHQGDSSAKIMKAWTESLKSKAISGDSVLPTRIENIFFKAWVDNAGIISTFRQLNVKAGAVYAMVGGDNATAKGHAKGATKVNQELNAVRRDIKALAIYKKLPIDLQDLFDDETGELLAFRVEELSSRVAHAIAVGAILGNGNEYLKDGRGLNPMATDINATEGFGTHVATKIVKESTDGAYEVAIRALGAVKGDDKVLIVPRGWRTNVLLAKNAQGSLLLPVGADLEAILGARIFELDEMTTFEAIAYANQSYVIAGEASATVRTDFDLDKNQDVMLVERYVGGSAQGYKTVAGVVKA